MRLVTRALALALALLGLDRDVAANPARLPTPEALRTLGTAAITLLGDSLVALSLDLDHRDDPPSE